MKEAIYLILTSLSIFMIILLGIIFGDSFAQKATYLELFILYGSVLFIISVLIVAAYFGFKYFSIFLAILFAVIIYLAGLQAAFIASVMTYLLWGMVFAIQLLLFAQDVKSAKQWFQIRYKKNSFKKEFFWFYPLLWIFYILLEVLPNIIYRDSFIKINPKDIYKKMESFLKN